MNIRFLHALLLITATCGSLVAKKDKDSVLDDINQRTAYIARKVTSIEEMQKCSTVIMQSDVGTSGYVISTPGQYCLGEDIVFAPENPATFTPITITDSTGSGAEGLAAVSGGVVRGIFVVSGGSGYTAPTISIGGSGSGAAATATLSGGSIVNFNVTSGGSGYRDTVQAAITITCGNVNLQMKNCTLSQAGGVDASSIPNYSGVNNPSSQVPFVVGILIPDTLPTDTNVNDVGIESVYISGDQAIIDGFSMWGVYCQGHVADVSVTNMTIKNCGLLASYYLRPFPTYFPNGFQQGRYPQAGTIPLSVGGINLGEADMYGFGPYFFMQNFGIAQNRISNVNIENVSSLGNYFLGMNSSNATNVYLNNSHFDGTLCDDPNVGLVGATFGIAADNYEYVMNLVVENTTFNNTNYIGDSQTELTEYAYGGATGCFLARVYNFTFNNCHCDNVTSTFATDAVGQITWGCLAPAVFDGTWQNCTFSNITSLGTVFGIDLTGFDFFGDSGATESSRNIRLNNCVASNLQQNGQILPDIVVGGTQACGFSLAFPKNICLENCVASDIIVNGPCTSTGSAAGFYFIDGAETAPEYETDNAVLQGCSVQRIIVNQGGNAIGFKILPQYGPQNILRTVSLNNCIAQGCQSAIPMLPGRVQGVGCGFLFESIAETDQSYPISFTNCSAMHNKGVPSIFVNASQGTVYSAGFLSYSADADRPVKAQTYTNCQALDNVYGFMFKNGQQIAVRNCQADLNVADDGVTGAGYTDLGLQSLVVTSTVSANLVAPTPSVFGIGTVGTSPVAGEYTGDEITFPNPNSSNFGFVGLISAYSGSPDYQVTLAQPLPNAPADGDPVAIYTIGTPASPLQSFSLFQSNKAFENGAGSTHFGPNGNYNVKYGAAATDYVPTLTGNLTNPNALGGSYFPEANYIAHNLSITQS